MAGSILQKARRDARKFLTSGGFEENITLISADGLNTTATKGWASKHWINYGTDGLPANSKNAHITIDEELLKAAGFVVRNANKEVFLEGVRVNVDDSSGEIKNYIIKEWFPDETLGLIACILGDYELD